MTFDALLKKYFPLVVLSLLAIMVYFQASAIGHWVSEALAPDPGALGPAGPQTTEDLLRSSRAGPARKSAEPIIERNPFDSVTGPLTPKPDAGPQTPAVPRVTDPLSVPACEGVRAQIVTEAEDPRRSIAALQTGEGTQTRVYHVGDSVGDLTVEYIGYNPRERSPAVWMSKGAVLCQALLFKDAPNAPAPPPPPEPEAEAQPDEPEEQKGLVTIGPELRARIHRRDGGVEVDSAIVDDILADRTQLMPSEKILPEQWEGKVVGIRIFGIKPDTLLGQLGFQSGDRLEAINGIDIENPAQARDAWGMLEQGNLEIRVHRRGKPVTFSIAKR